MDPIPELWQQLEHQQQELLLLHSYPPVSHAVPAVSDAYLGHDDDDDDADGNIGYYTTNSEPQSQQQSQQHEQFEVQYQNQQQ